MGMVSEFKDFAMKGNVVDMAVGIVIGGAFGKIVSSFVADVLMPPIGLLLGGMDFSNLAVTLQEAAGDAEAVMLNYGSFIQTVVDFLIIAFAIFLVVQQNEKYSLHLRARSGADFQLLNHVQLLKHLYP